MFFKGFFHLTNINIGNPLCQFKKKLPVINSALSKHLYNTLEIINFQILIYSAIFKYLYTQHHLTDHKEIYH